jgi:hypothetical protein
LLGLRGVVWALAVGVGALVVLASIGALLRSGPITVFGRPRSVGALLGEALPLLRGGFGGCLLRGATLLLALRIGALPLGALLLRPLHWLTLPIGLLACPLSLFFLRSCELCPFAFGLSAVPLSLLLLIADCLCALAIGAFGLGAVALSLLLLIAGLCVLRGGCVAVRRLRNSGAR